MLKSNKCYELQPQLLQKLSLLLNQIVCNQYPILKALSMRWKAIPRWVSKKFQLSKEGRRHGNYNPINVVVIRRIPSMGLLPSYFVYLKRLIP